MCWTTVRALKAKAFKGKHKINGLGLIKNPKPMWRVKSGVDPIGHLSFGFLFNHDGAESCFEVVRIGIDFTISA